MKRRFLFPGDANAEHGGTPTSGTNSDTVTRELTYGERAVGITFNPGGLPQVNAIKKACAAAIDELHEQRVAIKAKLSSATPEQNEVYGEQIAQFTLGIRKIQGGQMWGVKAATWQG